MLNQVFRLIDVVTGGPHPHFGPIIHFLLTSDPRSRPKKFVTNQLACTPSQTRASVRYSTFSMTPSITPTVLSSDSVTAEIRPIVDGLERMKNPPLAEQRVFLNEEKMANFAKLALGAKLDRALNRRMTGQDAVMRPRKPSVVEISEKEKA